MTPLEYPGEAYTPAPDSWPLVQAARRAGLVSVALDSSDDCPLIVYQDGRAASAERLGRRLVVAMREAVRGGCEGADDHVVQAAILLVALHQTPGPVTAGEHRAAFAALVDAVTPYMRDAGAWDAEARQFVLTAAQRRWVRVYAGMDDGGAE